MAPLISIGATTPVCRSPVINLTVSHCPIGASLTKRSPRGFQPLSRSMLVVTAVSSINTRWAGSRKPCSRIQRRRARATSARLRSAARRLFFNGDAMASKKSGKRAAAAWDSPLVKRRNDLIQREARFLADEGEDLPRVLLQWRSTPSTGHGFESPVFTKALHPPDRRTDADIKLFGRLTSGSSFFHEVDDARSQLTRIRSMHWAALRRINALDSHLRRGLGSPDSLRSGRAVGSTPAKESPKPHEHAFPYRLESISPNHTEF